MFKINPYKELHWLWKQYKDLPIPIVLEAHNLDVGGYYRWPCAVEKKYCDFDFIVPKNTAVIAIDFDNRHKDILSTIAHEFRHYWQFYNHFGLDESNWNAGIDCDKQIVDFFRQSRSEMDSLLFSCKVAPCSTTDYWMRLLGE